MHVSYMFPDMICCVGCVLGLSCLLKNDGFWLNGDG